MDWAFIFKYQTLISGILAIIAALITAIVIWRSAQLPFKKQSERQDELEKKKLTYLCAVLSDDLHLLAARVRMAEGTINNIIHANGDVTDDVREKTTLSFHKITDEWEFMSLLPSHILKQFRRLHRKITDHNFDMQRAGGAFGADNFRQSILARTRTIYPAALGLSQTLSVTGNNIDEERLGARNA